RTSRKSYLRRMLSGPRLRLSSRVEGKGLYSLRKTGTVGLGFIMKRSAPLRRYTPIKKKRSKPRRGEPTAEEKARVRLAVFERAEGKCELNLGPKCIKGALP